MKKWIVKVDGQVESESRDEESARAAAKDLEEIDGIQPDLIDVEEVEDEDHEFVAAVIVDGEIVEAFSGRTAVEAAVEAVHYMITEKPAKKIKVVVHSEITEEVVESFEMEDRN